MNWQPPTRFVYPSIDRWHDDEPWDNDLLAVFKKFVPFIGGEFCLAGGCVRDRAHYLKPRDYDLFCFEPPDRNRLLANFDTPADQQHTYRDMTCLTLYWTKRRRIAPNRETRQKRKVQVIYRHGLDTIPKLLEQFDWACCQWAWTPDGIVTIDSTQQLRPGGVLKLANPRTPETSLARGERIAERFRMTFDPSAITTLHGLIEGSGRRKALDAIRERIEHERKMAA